MFNLAALQKHTNFEERSRRRPAAPAAPPPPPARAAAAAPRDRRRRVAMPPDSPEPMGKRRLAHQPAVPAPRR
jgi:hypothetical protein